MRLAATILAGLTLALSGPLAAQDGGDKTQLDDFALPAASGEEVVEQLGARERSLATAGSAPGDREVDVPGPAAAARVPMPQLSQPRQPAPTVQLSDQRQSRQLASGSVSSPGDSRPQASAALGGTDRCDPQLETPQLEECRRVIERRAAEFDAPEAPQLSAEQVLLAQRGDEAQRLVPSSDMRLRLAAEDPDADRTSNQELASIYLDRQTQPPAGRPAQPEAALVEALAEVLQGLQITLPPAAAP